MIYMPYTKLSDEELLARIDTMEAPGDLAMELKQRFAALLRQWEDHFDDGGE